MDSGIVWNPYGFAEKVLQEIVRDDINGLSDTFEPLLKATFLK